MWIQTHYTKCQRGLTVGFKIGPRQSRSLVIYADFESMMVQNGPNRNMYEPLAAAGVLVYEGQKVEYASFDGEGCVVRFLDGADRMSRDIVYPWYETHGKVPMLPLAPIQEVSWLYP